MVELLKSRHLAPIYGEKTPLAPEQSDSLIIDPVPDVFHAGHVHVWGVSEYRGVVVANSGAWQMQTNYQKSMGIEPQPGVVPVLNLASFKTTNLNFL
jgi:DNA polymerase II small subunit